MILKILSYSMAFPPFIWWCNFERKDDTLSCVLFAWALIGLEMTSLMATITFLVFLIPG